MKTRILRFLLPAILVAAGAGSVAWTWALAQHVDRLESTGKQSAARIDRLDGLLDELARDQLTYVASGQIDKETLTATSARLRQMISESTWLLGQSLAGAARPAGAHTMNTPRSKTPMRPPLGWSTPGMTCGSPKARQLTPPTSDTRPHTSSWQVRAMKPGTHTA